MYIAKAPSTAASFNGQGAVWTKIYQSGLLNSTTWASDVVNANQGQASSSINDPLELTSLHLGKHSVTIPTSLPAGEYLLRSEIVRTSVMTLSN